VLSLSGCPKQPVIKGSFWPDPGLDDRQLPVRPLRTASFRWDDRGRRGQQTTRCGPRRREIRRLV